MKPTSIRLRSGTLDTIRGLTLVSMIVYHACWDLVYLYRLDWGWYRSFWAGIWQQSICCTFILLSGFCWQMGRHPLRRGLMSFFGGAAVSLATLLVLPEEPVQFGVLTFLGSAALLTIPLRPLLSHASLEAVFLRKAQRKMEKKCGIHSSPAYRSCMTGPCTSRIYFSISFSASSPRRFSTV